MDVHYIPKFVPDKVVAGLAEIELSQVKLPSCLMMPFDTKVGPLSVGGDEQFEPTGTRFKAVCDCGAELIVPAWKILMRTRFGIGCGRIACPHTDFDYAILRCSDTALEAQHRFLMRFHREKVQSFWGGTWDKAFHLPKEQGLHNFIRFAEDHGRPYFGEWWIKRKTRDWAFEDDGVVYRRYPPQFFFGEDLSCRIGGMKYRLREVSDKVGCSVPELVRSILMKSEDELDISDIIN